MKKTVGIRKLRDELTRHLGQVRRGGQIIITDRGSPVAVLLPYARKGQKQDAQMQAVLSGGHVHPAERRFLVKPPLAKGHGPLPSRLIAQGRR